MTVVRPRPGLKRLLGGTGAAIGLKIATGFAVAALAATAAVAATQTSITGSVNQVAHQHGKAVSEEHKASAAPELASGNSNLTDDGNRNANGASSNRNDNRKGKHKTPGQGLSTSQNPQPWTSSDPEPADRPITPTISWIPPQP